MRGEHADTSKRNALGATIRRDRGAIVAWIAVASVMTPAASRFVRAPEPRGSSINEPPTLAAPIPSPAPPAEGPRPVSLADAAPAPTLPGVSRTAHGRSVRAVLRARARVEFTGAEIVAYEPRERALFVTGDEGVLMTRLNENAGLTPVRLLDVSAMAGFVGPQRADVTHVTVDPARRGVGVALVTPRDRAQTPGRIVFFRTDTGERVRMFGAGFLPDGGAFTTDGRALVVVNEGEPGATPDGGLIDPPGSVTVVRLDGVRTPDDVRSLGDDAARTVVIDDAFVSHALASPDAARRAVRIHPHNRATPALDIEPEYAAIVGSTAFITLQENNAIGVFDIDAMRWTGVHGLGVIEQRIDASDRDGGPRIDRVVAAMPMPDHVAAYEVDGRAYLVTPNEGDVREQVREGASPLADHASVAELAAGGRLSEHALATLDLSDAALGRLHVCAYTGDLTGDGLIDRPAMLGARSVSVWDAATMERLSDTGDAFERWMAREAPEHFNADTDDLYNADARSTRRGPEPEGVAIGHIGGRIYAFVSLERPGAVAVIDVTNPRSISVVDLLISARWGDAAPEGLAFIGAPDSPTGAPLLVVAYEASGTVVTYEVVPPY